MRFAWRRRIEVVQQRYREHKATFGA
jgi:hypothetical protein